MVNGGISTMPAFVQAVDKLALRLRQDSVESVRWNGWDLISISTPQEPHRMSNKHVWIYSILFSSYKSFSVIGTKSPPGFERMNHSKEMRRNRRNQVSLNWLWLNAPIAVQSVQNDLKKMRERWKMHHMLPCMAPSRGTKQRPGLKVVIEGLRGQDSILSLKEKLIKETSVEDLGTSDTQWPTAEADRFSTEIEIEVS